MTTATLVFTASGDDGASGTAAIYDLRVATVPILTEADFEAARPLAREPAPRAAGSGESIVARSLAPGAMHYFALKVVDNVGNASPMSNLAIATTLGGQVAFSDDMEAAREAGR
jgi:hypothetical protein